MSTKPKYPHVMKAIFDTPWAVHPATLQLITEIATFRAEGGHWDEQEVQRRIAAASNGPRRGAQAGYVAVIPIYGVISQRQNLMSMTSGGTSVDSLTMALREAMADPEVGSIVFDIDSPGGTVDGVAELADEIRAGRGQKPMTSVVNTGMFSAALWLGVQADRVVSMPTGQMGSIGVIAAHMDDSAARAEAGLKRTLIATPPRKADGFNGDPLSEEGIAEIAGINDEYYGMFVNAVAKARAVSVDVVRDTYGKDAHVMTAKSAHKAGLIDEIDTLDNTIAKAARTARRGNAQAAAGPTRIPIAAVALDETEVPRGTPTTDNEHDAAPEEAPVAESAVETADPHDQDADAPAESALASEPAETVESDENPAETPEPGRPHGGQLGLASAQVEELAAHARARAELRAKEGRGLSEANRADWTRIRAAADSVLGASASSDGPGPDPAPATDAPGPTRQGGLLDVFEAAARGGYHLPH